MGADQQLYLLAGAVAPDAPGCIEFALTPAFRPQEQYANYTELNFSAAAELLESHIMHLMSPALVVLAGTVAHQPWLHAGLGGHHGPSAQPPEGEREHDHSREVRAAPQGDDLRRDVFGVSASSTARVPWDVEYHQDRCVRVVPPHRDRLNLLPNIIYQVSQNGVPATMIHCAWFLYSAPVSETDVPPLFGHWVPLTTATSNSVDFFVHEPASELMAPWLHVGLGGHHGPGAQPPEGEREHDHSREVRPAPQGDDLRRDVFGVSASSTPRAPWDVEYQPGARGLQRRVRLARLRHSRVPASVG